jgi:hypothetical protein
MSLYQFLSGKQQFATLSFVGEPDKVIEGKHGAVACYRMMSEKGKLQQNNQGFSPHSLGKKIGSQSLTLASQVSNQPEWESWHLSPSRLRRESTYP